MTQEETMHSIARWADETFGPAASMFRVATRANEELAECLRAVAAKQPYEKIIEEAADTLIVLCRVGVMLNIPDTNFSEWSGMTRSAGNIRSRVLGANKDMSRLLYAIEYWSASDLIELFGSVVMDIKAVAEAADVSLQGTIDAKMKINRQRAWKLDGTGHGYHVRQEPAQ